MNNKIIVISVCLLIFALSGFSQQQIEISKTQAKRVPVVKIVLPDLIVSNIEIIKIESLCKVELTIRNIGTAGVQEEKYGMVGDDSKASSVRVKIGSIPSTGRYLRLVDPEGKLRKPGGVVKHVWFRTDDFSTIPDGLHSIAATVDDNGKIVESNEKNNRLTKRLTCKMPLRPDLTIQRIFIRPGNPKKGDLIHFMAQIKNIGSKKADPSKALFRIGGETHGQIFPIPALNPGDVFTITRRLKLKIAQNYLAIAEADTTGVIFESDEGNNRKKFPFKVY